MEGFRPRRRKVRQILASEALPVAKEPKPEDLDDLPTIRAAVKKLHTNLGHPSNQSLARAIRLKGV